MRTPFSPATAWLHNSGDAARLWLLAIGLSVPGLWLLLHSQLSLLVFIVIGFTFAVTWHYNKAATILAMFSFLLLLGDIRRISSLLTGTTRLDPLLLIGPLFTVYVGVPLLLRVRLTDALSKTMLALTVILALAIFNPRQGPILVGLSGGLFFLIPMFWFWIARQYASARLLFVLIYRVMVPLGVLAALLGIYQTYVGFFPWEAAWIKTSLASGYSALNLGNGQIRSFGFSVNSVEYGTILTVSTVCVVAAIAAGRRSYVLLLPVLLTALILASQRGALVKLMFGAVAIWAVRGGRRTQAWLPRIIVGAVIGAGLLVYLARQAGDSVPQKNLKGSAANLATSHVTQGLAHPLDQRYSTAGTHLELFRNGILAGFVNPLGYGLGITTLGAGKFGADSGIAGSSEVDISDVFVATGFIGGLFYLFTIGLGLMTAGRFVRKAPGTLSYALIGIFCCMLGAWIPLGQYALGPFLWFCVGFLARNLRNEALSSTYQQSAERDYVGGERVFVAAPLT